MFGEPRRGRRSENRGVRRRCRRRAPRGRGTACRRRSSRRPPREPGGHAPRHPAQEIADRLAPPPEADARRLRPFEKQAHVEVSSELGLEVRHGPELRIGEIVRRKAQLGEPAKDVPAQKRRGAELPVFGVGRRRGGVGHRVGSQQDELSRDRLSSRQPGMKEAGEALGAEPLEEAAKRRLRQVEARSLAFVDLGVKSEESIEVVILGDRESLRAATVHQPPQILLRSRP